MPGIQELINRNRNQRGVQVYSPYRPLRPQGGYAGGNTARRILNRDEEEPYQPRPQITTPLVPGGFGGPSGMDQPVPMAGSLLDRIAMQNQEAAQNPQLSTMETYLGTAVNSGPGQVIMGALDLLDRPRRAVVSTVNEIADAFNGGEASFQDWANQIEDPSFGFGDVIGSTGNRWADRAIGFVGDVLLDPLTYVAGSSIIAGAGGRSRANAAARAVASGMDEDVARRLGRLGYSTLDNEQRAVLREAGDAIQDAGYRFKVPFGPSYQIPRTGRIETGVSGTFARARARLAETHPATVLRRWRSPEGLEEAYERLITGRGNIGFNEAAELVNFSNAERAARGTALSRMNMETQRFIATNGNEVLNGLLDQAEREGGTKVNEFFDRMLDLADRAGVQIPKRERYVPHIFTEAAAAWLRGDTPVANAFRRIFFSGVELDEISPHLMARRLTPQEKPYILGNREFNIKTGTIAELNAEFARVVPESVGRFTMLDTNFSSIASRYAHSISTDIGKVGGVKALLNSKSGLVRRAADGDDASEMVVNEIATKTANDEQRAAIETMLRSAKDLTAQIRDDTYRGVSGIQGVLGVQLREVLDELQTLTPETKRYLDNLLEREEELARQRGARRTSEPRHFEVDAEGNTVERRSQLEEEFDNQIAKLDKRFNELERMKLRLQKAAAAESRIWQQAKADAAIARRIESQPQRFKALREWNKLNLQQAQMAQDRAALEAINQRIAQQRLKGEILDRRINDPSFLNLAAGDAIEAERYAPRAPGEIRVETDKGPLRRGRLVSDQDSPKAVRLLHQKQRNEILGENASAEARELANRINTQIVALDAAERKLDDLAEIHGPTIERTQTRAQRARNREQELNFAVVLNRGDPAKAKTLAMWEARLDAHRGPDGELGIALREYEAAQRPVSEARRRVQYEENKLQKLRIEQTNLVKREFRPVPATSALPNPEIARIEARLRTLRQGAKTDVKRAGQVADLDRELDKLAQDLAVVEATIRRATEGRYASLTINEKGNVVLRKGTKTDPTIRRVRDDAQKALAEKRRLLKQQAKLNARRATLSSSTADEVATLERRLTDLKGQQRTPTPQDTTGVERRMQQIGAAEAEALRLARHRKGLKYEWEPVPEIANRMPSVSLGYRRLFDQYDNETWQLGLGRVGDMDIQDRMDLEDAYRTLRNTAKDDHDTRRALRQKIKEIEARSPEPRTLSQIRAQSVFDEMEQALAVVHASRTPVKMRELDPAALRAITQDVFDRGGSTNLVDRAKANIGVAQRITEEHRDFLVDRGALLHGDFRYLEDQIGQLEYLLKMHARKPMPYIKQQIDQLSADIGRQAGFMARYKIALDHGLQPSDQLAAFILERELQSEVRVLDSQIAKHAELVNMGGEMQLIQAYEQRVLNHETEIARARDLITTEQHKLEVYGEWDADAVKRARSRLNYHQRKIRNIKPPELGILGEDVDSIVELLGDQIVKLDNAVSDLRAARVISADMQWPIRKRAELEASIPRQRGEFEEMRQAQGRLRKAITKAENAGSETVRYSAWRRERFKVSVEQAEEMLAAGEVPEYLVRDITRKTKAARAKLDRGNWSNRPLVEWPEIKRGQVIEMPIDEAHKLAAKNEVALQKLAAMIENNATRLSVIDQSAGVEINRLNRLIKDQTTPPDPARLQREIDELKRVGQRTPSQEANLVFAQHRLDQLSREPMSAEELKDLIERRNRLGKAVREYRDLLKDQGEYAAAAMDNGYNFMLQLVNGTRDVEDKDLRLLRELLGAEAGPYAATWVRTINSALGVRFDPASGRRIPTPGIAARRITEDDLQQMFTEIMYLHGESAFGQHLLDRILGASGDALYAGGIDEGVIRNELFSAISAAAATTHQQALRDFGDMYDRLGLRVSTMYGLQGRLQALGYDLSKLSSDEVRDLQSSFSAALSGVRSSSGERKLQSVGYDMARQTQDWNSLRAFVVRHLTEMGYDPRKGLEDRLSLLRMRRQRLRTMRRGLGGITRSAQFKDPRRFHAWLIATEAADSPEDVEGIVRELTEFQTLTVPDDIAQVTENRIATLQEELVRAMKDGRSDDVLKLTDEINGLREGRVPDAPPPAPDVTSPEPDMRQALEEQRRTAQAALDKARADLTRAQQGDDVNAAGFSQAQIDAQAAKIREFIANIEDPDNLTPAQNAALDQLEAGLDEMTRRPNQFESLARAIGGDAPAQQHTPDPERLAQLAEAQQRAEDLVRQIDDELAKLPPRAEISASPSMVDDPSGAAVSEGLPPEGPMPDERLALDTPDDALSADEIRAQYDDAIVEYNDLRNAHGSYENAPPEAQAMMAQLSARAQALAKQNAKTLRAEQDSFLAQSTPHQEFDALRQPATPTISYAWRTILRDGSPSADVMRQMLKTEVQNERMLRTLQGVSGARGTLSGPFARGGTAVQEEAAQARLRPLQDLTDKMQAQRDAVDERIGLLEKEAAPLKRSIGGGARRDARIAKLEQIINPSTADLQQKAERSAARYNELQRQNLVERANVGLERMQAEREYTERLQQLDMHLGEVRSAIVAAKQDIGYMDAARQRLEAALDDIPGNTAEFTPLITEMREVNKLRRQFGANDADIANVEAMLAAAADEASALYHAQVNEALIQRRLDDFANGAESVAPVMMRVLRDGWDVVRDLDTLRAEDLADKTGAKVVRKAGQPRVVDDDAVVMAESLSGAFKNLSQALRKPEAWKLIDKYTAFFKTYATARPGFHVRNAMSGVFMNLVDGVKMRNMTEAIGVWRAFTRDPANFWERADDRTRNALTAVFGSGAGGQFIESGVGPEARGAGGKLYRRLMNNALTHWNRRWGSNVEGSIRLGMALDSMDKGMSVAAALDRISKFHFDYTQVSTMDRAAKRLIPFWTFASRNLPLQIEQMWLRPRTYLQYQSFVRNFSGPGDPLTPQYWLAQGAFSMSDDPTKEESPWLLAPDLPHLRIAEPFQAMAQGEMGKALLSDINPLFLAPLEAFGINKKVYTGAPIEENYSEPQGPMGALAPLFSLLGGTQEGGTSGSTLIDDRYAHVARSLLPPLELLERISNETGPRAGRQDETIYRTMFGAPVYQLTPELRESTRKQQYYDRRRRRESQAELARS